MDYYDGKYCQWGSRTHRRTSNAIEAALGGLRFTCCVVYIDDVVVHSKGSFEDHLTKVRAALRALRVVGFSGNSAKCKFAQRDITFLGHRVADEKVYALDDKVK